jgi:O-antigen/teichoic acid export membrane protein
VLRHSAAYFAVRAVNGILALTSIYLLTRWLTREQYGHYALGMAAINVASALGFQAIGVAAARFHPTTLAPQGPSGAALSGETWRLFGRAAAVVVALGSVAALAAHGFGAQGAVGVPMIVAITLGAVVMGLHNLGLQFANVQGNPLRYGWLTTSRSAFVLALALALVSWGYGAVGALTAVVVGGLLSVSLFSPAQPWRAPRDRDPQLRRQLVDYGVPLALTYMAAMVVDVADRFLIASFHGPSAVGSYAAAYDLAQQTISVVLNVFFLAAYPKIVAAWERDGASAARASGVPLGQAFAWAAPFVLATFVGLAPEIARTMFGAAMHADAARLLPWIALATTIAAFKAFWLDIAFVMTRDTAFLWRNSLWMAITNVALNLALMPTMGPVGSAYAAVAAFALGAARSWWYGRARGVLAPLRHETRWSIAAGLIMTGILLSSAGVEGADHWVGVVLRWLIAATVFIAAAWAANAAGVRDRLRTRRS